jgi:hypothetical protein
LSTTSRVSLLDVEPELGPLLTAEQRDHAQRFALAMMTVDVDTDVIGLLEDAEAFGAVVLDGMLVESVHVTERASLRLIGPGGVVPAAHPSPGTQLATLIVQAAAPSRLAVLDASFLIASHHWPQLTALLYTRALEHSMSSSIQLAISHLARVEDRLMAVMWLLAEHWGHVTSSGVRLHFGLTHDVLGALIGGQRSTVTLALTRLAERGALIRQNDGWLIVDPPPVRNGDEVRPTHLLHQIDTGSAWRSQPGLEPPQSRLGVIRAELARMRARSAADQPHARKLRDQSQELCARAQELVGIARAPADGFKRALAADAERTFDGPPSRAARNMRPKPPAMT